MREYKFRGRRVDNGEWVKGYYYAFVSSGKTIASIDDGAEYMVDPETVGQYTGLPDNKGIEICDGDRFQRGTDVGTVVFERGAFWVVWDEPHSWQLDRVLHRVHSEGDVIGNIHDHPHLLGVSGND